MATIFEDPKKNVFFLRLEDDTLVNLSEILEATLKDGTLKVTIREESGTSYADIRDNAEGLFRTLKKFSVNP